MFWQCTTTTTAHSAERWTTFKLYFLFSFIGSELLQLDLDLLHAVLVELFPVSEEEEDLEDDEERRGDEGLVPGVQQRGGAALEHTVPDKLRMQVQEMMMWRCTVRCTLTWTIHMTTWKASTACHSG